MTRSHRLFSLVLLVSAGLLLSSCDSSDPDDGGPDMPEPGFDRAAMLENIGQNVITPAYAALEQATAALSTAADGFAAAPSASTLDAAQAALKDARMAWQAANLFQFGPAESAVLRGSLNTYPADMDRIEANISEGGYVLGTVANQAAGGFPTLGYLLHSGTDEDVVALFSTDALATPRAQYLADNVAFVRTNVNNVANQWRATYLNTFLSPDQAGVDVGSSVGQLTNAMVLHYERFLRDGKIGIPAGVRSAGIPRPLLVEALYAGYSVELAVANVEAMRRLFKGISADGADGLGYDDYLVSLDNQALSEDIDGAFVNIVTSLQGLNDPLPKQIEDDPQLVNDTFVAMQQLVALLKADLTSVLGVTITFQDTDGD